MALTRRRRLDCDKPGISRRRRVFFKKGHSRHDNKVDYIKSSPTNWIRLPLDMYMKVTTRHSGGGRIVPDIHNQPSDKVKLLRPLVPKPKLLSSLPDVNISNDSNSCSMYSDNYIISIDKMMDFVNEVVTSHSQTGGCDAPEFKYLETKKRGLCVTVRVQCKNCNYKSDKKKLYSELQSSKKGPKTAIPNISLQCALLDSTIGNFKASQILNTMGVPTPSLSHMQSQANQVGTEIISLNKRDMANIRGELKEINTLRGQLDMGAFNVSMDGRYNTERITTRGKLGQGASQVVELAIENLTDDRKVIDIAFQNKLCWRGAFLRAHGFPVKCGSTGVAEKHRHKKCTANFPETDPFTEHALGMAIAKNLGEEGIHIEYLCSDQDSSTYHGVQEATSKIFESLFTVKYQVDPIHLGQSMFRAGMKADFSTDCFPGSTADEKKTFRKLFMLDVKSRSSRIFKLLFLECNGDVTKVGKKLGSTVQSVVECYSGNCSKCRSNRFNLCGGGIRNSWWSQSEYFKAYGQSAFKLSFTESDKRLLQLLLEIRLGESALQTLKTGYTTNKVEATNRALSASLPKNITFSRNALSRVHSAVHRVNNSLAKSAIQKLEHVKIPVNPQSHAMKNLQRLADRKAYNIAYRKQPRVKQHNKKFRIQRMNEFLKAKKNRKSVSDYKKHHVKIIEKPETSIATTATPMPGTSGQHGRRNDHSYCLRESSKPVKTGTGTKPYKPRR